MNEQLEKLKEILTDLAHNNQVVDTHPTRVAKAYEGIAIVDALLAPKAESEEPLLLEPAQ